MTSWFQRLAPKLLNSESKTNIPAGVWIKCPECGETLFSKDLDKNLKVCPACQYHFRLTAEERIAQLLDEGTFREFDPDLVATDPLKFSDSKKYKDRIKQAMVKTNLKEAVTTGEGLMNGKPVAVGVFNFRFMGGSMGSVVGEKLTRMIEHAERQRIPAIIVSASGGARMQEGAFSLMQMAKTSAVLSLLEEAKIPYISILTDPTTGGVSASYGMLGDIIIAEPNALIGFAGPRVIEQTIKRKLPQGFQRAEFVLEHGFVDMVVKRNELKSTLFNLIEWFGF